MKLSPNVADIGAIAKAARGRRRRRLNRRQHLSGDERRLQDPEVAHRNPTGGLSGRAIKPITLRLVYEASRAVRIPVIGLGGIDTAEDVLEYFVVGASAVQVGTAALPIREPARTL